MKSDCLKVLQLVLIVTVLFACASGSHIITGKVRAPLHYDSVTLFTNEPASYETIGIVKASSDAGWSEQDSLNYAVEELKKQAAKLGANGVILLSSGEKISNVFGTNSTGGVYAVPVSAQTLTGKAIYIPE
jgi:hypothetical protein